MNEFISMFFGLLGLACAIGLIIFIASLFVSRTGQFNDYNTCQEHKANKSVEKKKCLALFQQLQVEVRKILKHEKDVFESITPQNVEFILVKYPELKAVAAVTSLIQTIIQMQKEIYYHDKQYNDRVRIIKNRQSQPWMFPAVHKYDIDYIIYKEIDF